MHRNPSMQRLVNGWPARYGMMLANYARSVLKTGLGS